MPGFRVRQEGPRVVLLRSDGRLVEEMPPEAAIALARALMVQARRAQEVREAERIAYDQAVLLRAGAPFGLTDHPAIQAEAVRYALYDRDLRRYLPGGLRSRGVVGTPAVVVQPPSGKEEHDGRLRHVEP